MEVLLGDTVKILHNTYRRAAFFKLLFIVFWSGVTIVFLELSLLLRLFLGRRMQRRDETNVRHQTSNFCDYGGRRRHAPLIAI